MCSNISMLGDTMKEEMKEPLRDHLTQTGKVGVGFYKEERLRWGPKDKRQSVQRGRWGGRKCQRRKEQMIMDLESRKCFPGMLLDPAWIITIVQFKELSLCHGKALWSLSTLNNCMMRALQQTLCPSSCAHGSMHHRCNSHWKVMGDVTGLREKQSLWTCVGNGENTFGGWMSWVSLKAGWITGNINLTTHFVWVEWSRSFVSLFLSECVQMPIWVFFFYREN